MRIALFALCALACTPSFESVSQVTDLRVLAVQTDPPEAQYDATSMEPVRVRVLAVDPRRSTPFEVTARGCFPTDSRRCDAGVALDLGQVGTDFTLRDIPPSVLEAARQDDRLKGLNGLLLQLELTVSNGDPNEQVVAAKLAVLSQRGSRTPNHLPLFERIDLSRGGQAAGSIAPGDPLAVPAGVEIGLRPVLTAGSREDYVATDLNGEPITLTEQPRYFFFTTKGGDFDRDTADEPLDGVAPSDGLSRLTVAEKGPGKLWIVVRDGRGGESWVEVPWTAL